MSTPDSFLPRPVLPGGAFSRPRSFAAHGGLIPLAQACMESDTDYFVLTTNVDHCFQKAGFDKERLFYMQGDYGLFQCSELCCRKTYDNEEIVR